MQLARRRLIHFVANLSACLVAMEVCASAYYWSRGLPWFMLCPVPPQKLIHAAIVPQISSDHFCGQLFKTDLKETSFMT